MKEPELLNYYAIRYYGLATYLICFLNDFIDAKDKLMESKPFLKKQD